MEKGDACLQKKNETFFFLRHASFHSASRSSASFHSASLASAMLKKKYRGLSRDQVAEVFSKDAKTNSNSFFRIRWLKTDDSYPQFVVITTPAFHRSAVKRNRVRRQVYEWIRLNFKDWTRGIRIAILVKKPALDAERVKFHQALQYLFSHG